MSKYQPLAHFLNRQKSSSVVMTFDEIEGVLGFDLPASQDNPAWWSNNADNNVMTKVWLDAGWRARNVRLKEREVTFYRAIVDAQAVDGETVRLDQLPPVARGVLSVLAMRSGRTLAREALAVLSEALEPRLSR